MDTYNWRDDKVKNKVVKAAVALSVSLMAFGMVNPGVKVSAAAASAPISVYEVSASILNVRSQPNTSSKVVDTLRKKDQIEIVKFYNAQWAQIKTTTTKNGIAYINTAYLSKLATTLTTTSNLNLRVDASTSSKVVTVIPKGAKVNFLGYKTDGKTKIDTTWAQVSYKNVKGYVNMTYVK